MRELVHNFLKWLPAAIGGGAIGVATVWPDARDWIGAQTSALWGSMSNPFVTVLVVLAIAAYAGAIVWTSKPRQSAAPAGVPALPPEAYEKQYRYRQMIIARGRELAHQYTTEGRERNFRLFLDAQHGYSLIRPHLSKAYLARHNRWSVGYASGETKRSAVLVQIFLNEIDRLAREWGLS